VLEQKEREGKKGGWVGVGEGKETMLLMFLHMFCFLLSNTYLYILKTKLYLNTVHNKRE